MERLKNFYKFDGFFYTIQKLKSLLNITSKLKKIDVYQHYISYNFAKSATNFSILVEENHNLELNRKLFNFRNFFSRFKLNLLLRLNESEILNGILNEKEIDVINKNLIILCKYLHTLEKNLIDKKMRRILNKFIVELSPKLDVITLMHIFSSKFFNQKKYGDNMLTLIEEKLLTLKAQNKNTVDRYLDTNIKDNSIIFCLINIISNSFMQELIWEFLVSVLERRIFNLNLAEAVTCTIFLLENRLVESYILKSLSIRIVHICNSKNISIDFKAYQIIFDKLPLLKIMLDFNKLSFDNQTEMIIEDLFCKYLQINQPEQQLNSEINDVINNNNKASVSRNHNNNKKQKPKGAFNNNNSNNAVTEQSQDKSTGIVLLETHYQNLEKSFYSNSSIILSKCDYTHDEIELILANFNNELHDSHYFKRFNLKKNPYDLFLLVKLLAKNSEIFKTIKSELLVKIVNKAINCFFSIENHLHNRLFFVMNISLAKDCLVLMRNLNTNNAASSFSNNNTSGENSNSESASVLDKKNILEKLVKISYKKITKNYFELRQFLFKDKKEVNKDLDEDMDKEELKYYFTTIALHFFEMFSLEKENRKYVYFKDMIIEDLKNLESMEVYNKNDLKNFVSLLKKDNMICEEFKNNIIKNNNYYF